MTIKSVLSMGLITALSLTSAASFADEKEQTQTRNTQMLQQANEYADKAGRNINYSDMKQVEKQEKPKYQYRYKEDNETGKGEKNRTRTRTESASDSQPGSSSGKNKAFSGRR